MRWPPSCKRHNSAAPQLPDRVGHSARIHAGTSARRNNYEQLYCRLAATSHRRLQLHSTPPFRCIVHLGRCLHICRRSFCELLSCSWLRPQTAAVGAPLLCCTLPCADTAVKLSSSLNCLWKLMNWRNLLQLIRVHLIVSFDEQFIEAVQRYSSGSQHHQAGSRRHKYGLQTRERHTVRWAGLPVGKQMRDVMVWLVAGSRCCCRRRSASRDPAASTHDEC